MSDTANPSADLRSQSNKNRIDFLRTELDACFTFVSLAETERSIGNDEHAKRSAANAEKAYATVQRFLSDPKHAKHINDQERQELTERMQQLRKKLDSFAHPESSSAP
jgi:hypothetical protein